MNLSNREQEIFQRIEQEFYAAQADEVPTDRQPQPVNYKRLVIGILVVLLGIALLIGAVWLKFPILGVVGFLVMVCGGYYGLRLDKSSKNAASTPRASTASTFGSAQSGKQRQSITERFEARWQRRMDGDV